MLTSDSHHIIVVLRYRRGRSVLFFLLCTLSPKAEAQARPHTGQFTFLLGSDSLAFLIARFLSSSVKRFCSNIITPMCTAVLQLLRSSAITVQFEGEILHRRNDKWGAENTFSLVTLYNFQNSGGVKVSQPLGPCYNFINVGHFKHSHGTLFHLIVRPFRNVTKTKVQK